MNIYYVSNAGCDANDGLTPETAWKTIQKVNASIEGGDKVCFRRGDTFYGRLNPKPGISMGSPTAYTAYGGGRKPILSQYKIAHADAWEKHDEHVWKLDLMNTANYDGNTSELTANVGFIKVSGRIFAFKRFIYEEIEKQWDFYCDEQYVYVYSDENPASLSDDIRFACQIGCIGFTDNLSVTNIIINGTGAHGISGVVNGAYIADCEFCEIGGSRLGGQERGEKLNTVRYGNGVETWSNSSDVTVERCKFTEIYDVAITMQGTEVRKPWKNMWFRDNLMWNCQQCFEIWSSGTEPGTGFVDCHFENNTCIDSGYCWGYEVRPNKDCSSHLLLYGLQCPLCDIRIKGNRFINARVATIYKSGGFKEIPDDYILEDNVIVRPDGQPVAWCTGKEAPEEYAAFEAKIAANNKIIDRDNYR